MTWFYVAAVVLIAVGTVLFIISERRDHRRTMSALDETYKILAQMADQKGWEVEKKDTTITVTRTHPGDDRDPLCIENWPDCYEGGYDPRCCRFPKSCSCTVLPEGQ